MKLTQDLQYVLAHAGNCSSIEFVVHYQVASGNLVMNERTDKITMGDNTIELPVMGVFEIRDGKISASLNYFDIGPFKAMGLG